MPVVPLTMSVSLMMDAAQRLDPARIAGAWKRSPRTRGCCAEPPVEVVITATRLDGDRIRVSIDGYIECMVTMADRYPDRRQLPAARRSAAEGVSDHGRRDLPGRLDVPRSGVPRASCPSTHWASGGMRATLRPLPARGALLDAAGQLVGLWACAMTDRDRLVLPVRVGKVEYFGPPPGPDEHVTCTVLTRSVRRHEVHADLDLRIGERRYAYVTDWVDWRFHTSGRLFDMMRHPGLRLLAEPQPEGFVRAARTRAGRRRRATSCCAGSCRRPRSRRRAGRRACRRTPTGCTAASSPRTPCAACCSRPARRRCIRSRSKSRTTRRAVRACAGRSTRDIRVSIAHKPGIAVALAAEGVDPGIDIEAIEPRGDGFASLAFGQDELALLPGGDRDEWLTRCWAAKEAAGKARGTGLAGNPKGVRITAIDADRILVDGRAVATRRLGDHVVAWTVR